MTVNMHHVQPILNKRKAANDGDNPHIYRLAQNARFQQRQRYSAPVSQDCSFELGQLFAEYSKKACM